MAARKTRKAAKGRKSPAKGKGRRRRNGADGPLIGFMNRTLRTIFHWAAVAVVIGIGLVGSVVAYYASKLPPMADWSVPPRAANVRILAADGQLISNHGDSAGEALTLDQMPPYLPEAVISIEDRRFYWNFGIDPIGLVRAAIVNLRAGHIVEGGSTLTQQLAKNLFLKPERTFERKVQEMILAVWLQMRLSKKQILALYLNRVYLGAGAYGVDAAAHRYFGKSARNITLAEAATLAGMLKAPANYSPATHPAASEARMQTVLTAMQNAGYITGRQASLAMSVPVTAVHDVAGGSGRYVADWVMDKLPQYVGGSIDQDIIVDTTIDLTMQADAAQAISQTLAEGGAKYDVGQAALVAIAPNGAVKAMVGGDDYKTSPFNRAVDAHRQPGSAFKPFVYLTALEDGMIPESVMVDQPVSIAGWKPENYTRKYKGPVTLRTALADSLNSVSAQLTAIVTPKAVAATARRLGIVSPLMATPSIALGTSEVTPLELTAAYVPFSNGGRGIIPYAIKRIVDGQGQGALRAQRHRAGAGGRPDLCRHDEFHAVRNRDRRHRHQGAHQGLAGGRQDRHIPGFSRCLVHRLHRRADRRRVVRQRQQFADQARHRRQPAGDRLAALHERGARRPGGGRPAGQLPLRRSGQCPLCRAAALPLRHGNGAGAGRADGAWPRRQRRRGGGRSRHAAGRLDRPAAERAPAARICRPAAAPGPDHRLPAEALRRLGRLNALPRRRPSPAWAQSRTVRQPPHRQRPRRPG